MGSQQRKCIFYFRIIKTCNIVETLCQTVFTAKLNYYLDIFKNTHDAFIHYIDKYKLMNALETLHSVGRFGSVYLVYLGWIGKSEKICFMHWICAIYVGCSYINCNLSFHFFFILYQMLIVVDSQFVLSQKFAYITISFEFTRDFLVHSTEIGSER